MMMKRLPFVCFVFFGSLVLAGCKNPLYIEEEIKSPDDVISIKVTTFPNKMLYKYGETFDKTGMKVTVHFRDSAQYPPKPVENKDVGISGYNPYAEGIQTVTVSARGKSEAFKIALMVIPIPPSDPGISVSVASDRMVTLPGAGGSSKDSWEAHVYDTTGKEVQTEKDSGTSNVSFELSVASVGTYTLAVAFRIDMKMHYRFYKLTVTI